LTNWSWSFPDATPATSTLENPQNVIFNTAGDKNVTLHVTNSDAKTCSLTQKVQVKTISPHWKEVVPK
jgi:PKD repeat protein